MPKLDSIDHVAGLFDRRRGGDGVVALPLDRRRAGESETGTVLEDACARARALTLSLGEGPEAERLALTVLVARGLSGLWIDRRWRADGVGDLLEEAARVAGVPVDSFTLGVSLYALCDPGLLELSPGLAMEAQVELLRALARLEDVSLWCAGSDGRLTCGAHAGGPDAPSRRTRAVARGVLDGREAQGTAGARRLFGVAVMRWQRPHAALVGRAPRGESDRGLAFLDQAAAMIGPMLERQALLERNAARERSLVQASERRLTRLGFDLHDRPLQEVAALATEMRSLREQLGADDPRANRREIMVGRVQDLEARLAVLDAGLRSMCHSLEPPTLTARPFREVLKRETDGWVVATGIDVGLQLEGNFDTLTDSQRIALVRIIQECLSNAREHSGASEVQVALRSTSSHVSATVTDNGRGFDVEPTLLDAARRGRLGLVGAHERARLLGGTCDVSSQPGGPTTVSVCLSHWDDGDAVSIAPTAEAG